MGASRVIYDGKRLIPGPLVSFSKSYQTTGDGTKIGSVFSISIRGTIVSFKGSPAEDGTFWTGGGYPPDSRSEPTYDENVGADARLGAILRKQEAIRELFSVDGKQLEWQSADGSQPLKCNPRVLSIDFSEDIWYNTCEYTINLEADIMYVGGNTLGEDSFPEYIQAADESWSFETDEGSPESVELNRTYRLTHNISAQGKRFFDNTGGLEKPAWQQARDWVSTKLGFDSVIALSSGVNNLPDYYGGFNHIRSESIDETAGNYSVTETWILSSGNALEDFSVNITENNEDGVSRVSIQGTIRGLETKDSNFNITSTKYDNANSKWTTVQDLLLNRAQSYSGKTLNILPRNLSVGKNPAAGTINYNYDYDNTANNLITDAKSESITLNDSRDIDVFASVGVLGRAKGPVLQNIGSHRAAVRSLNIELVFGPEYAGSGTITERAITNSPLNKEPQKTQIEDIVNSVAPVAAGAKNNIGGSATTSYISNYSENWDFKTGRFSLNKEWTYE